MTNTFLTSDSHFRHENFLTFLDKNGELIRKFGTVEEMDELMIARWNEKVSPNDKVYHLGDLCFSSRALNEIMPRLNGNKVLIKGNHDKLKVSQYMKYFRDIRSIHKLDRLVLTHVPIHPYMLERWKGNIHGHTHTYHVMDGESIDIRYYNVCVEKHNYYPVNFEDILKAYYDNGLI